jgi:hypothetical protein
MPEISDQPGINVGRIIVAAILLAALASAGAWDIFSAYRGYESSTISEVVQDWSTRWPVLPLLIGVLLGHLFWPSYPIR